MTVVTESLPMEQEIALTDKTNQDERIADDAATPPQDRLVPVTEAIRYRKRAQLAEQRLGDLERELAESRQRCEEAEQAVTSLDRRQRIDQLLSEADTVDLEAARLLTEVAVQAMDAPDVAAAIDDLRRHKPVLVSSAGRHAGRAGVVAPDRRSRRPPGPGGRAGPADRRPPGPASLPPTPPAAVMPAGPTPT